MSAVFRGLLARLWGPADGQGGNKQGPRGRITRALGPWEGYMVSMQSILIWDNPTLSAVAVVFVNALFWLIVWSDVQIFLIVPLLSLLAFVHQQWVHSIWPEIRVPPQHAPDTEDWTPVHPSVLSVPEISQYVEGVMRCLWDNYNWLISLRRYQPALFCALVSTVLSVTAVIGNLVPGAVLLYTVLMLVLTGPGIVLHVIPESFFLRLARIRAALRGDPQAMDVSSEDLAEFLPQDAASVENLAALDIPLLSEDPPEVEDELLLQEERAENNARRRKNKAKQDQLPTSPGNVTMNSTFMRGLPEDFPSIENDSNDDMEDADFDLPSLEPKGSTKTYNRVGEPAPAEMKFVSSHFGDSEDDDDFIQGLTFEERSQVDSSRIGGSQPPAELFATSSLLPSLTVAQASQDGLTQLMSSVIAANAGNILSALSQNMVSSVIGQQQIEPVSQMPHRPPSEGSRSVQHHIESTAESYSQSVSQSASLEEEDFELISDDEFE